MNFGELKQLTRVIAQDTGTHVLWKDEEISQALNEGYFEACRNAKLLKTSSLSFGETRSKSEISIFGTYGILSSLLVSNINIISNPVTYTSNDITTASLLANEINDTGYFEAILNNNIISLYPLPGNGTLFNNVMPIFTFTNSFATATQFSGGVDGICRIQLKPGVREYKFSDKILKIEDMYLGDNQKKLCKHDFQLLSDSHRKMSMERGDVSSILYGMSTNSFYAAKIPNIKDYINMTVFHLPLNALKLNSDIPVIQEQYHSKLIHYALYKLYQKNDIEAEQLDISFFHFGKFTEEFGDNQFAAASNQTTNLRFFFGD